MFDIAGAARFGFGLILMHKLTLHYIDKKSQKNDFLTMPRTSKKTCLSH